MSNIRCSMPSKELASTNTDKIANQRSPVEGNEPGMEMEEQIPLPMVAKQVRLDPSQLTPQMVLQLQRTIGNRAVQRMLTRNQTGQDSKSRDVSKRQPISQTAPVGM